MRLVSFTWVLSLACVATLTAAADDAREEAIKKERERFAGTWRVVTLEIDGNRAADQDARKITVINKADGTWVIRVDDKEVAKGTSQIDPTKKIKTIDFTQTEGEDKGKEYKGIYEISPNTRKLCFAPAGKDRPTEFAAPAGSGHFLVTFERVKGQRP